jgi:hypothetical protein
MYIPKIKGRKVAYLKMWHITEIPRNQMVFSSLRDTILPENSVCFVDVFVEFLTLGSVGFTFQTLKSEACPSPASRQAGLILKSFLKSVCMVI